MLSQKKSMLCQSSQDLLVLRWADLPLKFTIPLYLAAQSWELIASGRASRFWQESKLKSSSHISTKYKLIAQASIEKLTCSGWMSAASAVPLHIHKPTVALCLRKSSNSNYHFFPWCSSLGATFPHSFSWLCLPCESCNVQASEDGRTTLIVHPSISTSWTLSCAATIWGHWTWATPALTMIWWVSVIHLSFFLCLSLTVVSFVKPAVEHAPWLLRHTEHASLPLVRANNVKIRGVRVCDYCRQISGDQQSYAAYFAGYTAAE